MGPTRSFRFDLISSHCLQCLKLNLISWRFRSSTTIKPLVESKFGLTSDIKGRLNNPYPMLELPVSTPPPLPLTATRFLLHFYCLHLTLHPFHCVYSSLSASNRNTCLVSIEALSQKYRLNWNTSKNVSIMQKCVRRWGKTVQLDLTLTSKSNVYTTILKEAFCYECHILLAGFRDTCKGFLVDTLAD